MEIIANSKDPCGVTEIANLIGQDKSIVYRILNTFRSKGYIDQIEETKKYILGLKFFELCDKLQKKMDIIQLGRKTLEKLSEASGESVHLAVLKNSRVIYIDRVSGREIVGIHTSVGDNEPSYCTASGKAILAFLTSKDLENALDKIKENGLKKYTKNTISSIPGLLSELDKVRLAGVAYDVEELYKGVRCIAAPILNYKNKVIASVGVSGPSSRVNESKIKEISEMVLEAGKKISRLMGSNI
ncbi:MAG: IclR family transcriptional regulator [Actinobacteria bacterium]|nr:IclR family transcriptional regulator [Actinomycetota bacterium]